MSADVVEVEVLVCSSCEHVFELDDAGPAAYECGNDGAFVSEDGSRCPECLKFSAKESPMSCPECEAPAMADETSMYWSTDVGGETIYGPTQSELGEAVAQYEAENTPEAVEARQSAMDAHISDYRKKAAKRHAEYMTHVPRMRRVLEACGAEAWVVDGFTRDDDGYSASKTVTLDMEVFLKMIDLAGETVVRDERQ